MLFSSRISYKTKDSLAILQAAHRDSFQAASSHTLGLLNEYGSSVRARVQLTKRIDSLWINEVRKKMHVPIDSGEGRAL